MRSRSERQAARALCRQGPTVGQPTEQITPHLALLPCTVANDRRLSLAAPDAKGGEAARCVAPAHLVHERNEDPAAASSDRVPERDRPAMGVDPLAVDVQLS